MAENKIQPGDQVIESSELDMELFWAQHKTKVLGAAAAAVIVLAAVGGWFIQTSIASANAAALLSNAKDASGWEEVIRKYPHSEPAADAYFRLAAAQREAGKLDESTATFRKFLDAFPNNQLTGAALFGVGQNLDKAGKTDEALSTLLEVPAKYPQSYAAPFALFAASEIRLRKFDRDEARQLLQRAASEFPNSIIARLATAQLNSLGTGD